jgi:hypothetical protein
LPNLRRLARAPTPANTVAHSYARIGDDLLIFAIIPITSEDEATRIAYNPLRGYDYLAVVKVISREDFALASRSMSLDDFHFTADITTQPSNTLTVPVTTPDGAVIGNLVWRQPSPGLRRFCHALLACRARPSVYRRADAFHHATPRLASDQGYGRR